MFGTPQVERHVLNSMRSAMTFEHGRVPPLDAREVFRVAAARDDALLAKAAVRCLGSSGHSVKGILFTKPMFFVEGVPARYLHALLRSSIELHRDDLYHYGYSENPRERIIMRDCEKAASQFTLQ
jgi:hypothetical protein